MNGNEVYRSAPITGAETGEVIAISLPSGIEASTFRVEHSTNYLHLTEIQVLGYPIDPTVATAGDDTIDGGAGDDLIIGDGIDAVVRESFNWDQFNNQQIDDARSTPFVQNTGNVNVSFTRPSDNTNHDGFVGNNDNNVSGIDSGGEVANDESTLGSLHTGHGGFGQFQWDFSEEVSDVSFRINDIDQGSIVAVRAFDANGNQVVVDYDLGAGLRATESDGFTGAETIRYFGSNHPNPSATASENSVLVSVEGPIAHLVVDHAGDSGGINVTDIFFDAPVAASAGDDVLDGGAGDDVIFGDNAQTGLVTTLGENLIAGGTFTNPADQAEWFFDNGAFRTDDEATFTAPGMNIRQTIDTTPGETYQITFFYDQVGGSAALSQELTLWLENPSTGERFQTETYEFTNGESGEITVTFTAPSEHVRLRFQETSDVDRSNQQIQLDNIEVRQVTEEVQFGGISGATGDDLIDGGAGDDVIFGDNGLADITSNTAVNAQSQRESFNWEGVTDHQIDSSVTQSDGTVSVTYSRGATSGNTQQAQPGHQTININGVVGNGVVDNDSSLHAQGLSTGGNSRFNWEFSQEVGNVSFNVSDIDGSSTVDVHRLRRRRQSGRCRPDRRVCAEPDRHGRSVRCQRGAGLRHARGRDRRLQHDHCPDQRPGGPDRDVPLRHWRRGRQCLGHLL